MNFEDAVEKSSVIRPDHKGSFIECLRKIPDFSWALGEPNSRLDRVQGDFFKDFPVVFLDPAGTPLPSRKHVMLVNNSCDLPPERNPMVTVALVLDFAKYLKSLDGRKTPEAIKNHARDVRENQISELLFVPSLAGFSEGAIVRLDHLSSVAYALLDQAVKAGARIASFTQSGLYVLLLKLTHHLTRPESSEVVRTESSTPPSLGVGNNEPTRWLWFDDKPQGPFNVEKMFSMATAGEILPTTFFWSEARQEWLPLRGIMFDMESNPVEQALAAGIQEIEVLGSGENACAACSALIGKTFPISLAPEMPPADCACVPWCRLVLSSVS